MRRIEVRMRGPLEEGRIRISRVRKSMRRGRDDQEAETIER